LLCFLKKLFLKIIIHHNIKHVFLIPVFKKWWIRDPFHIGEKTNSKEKLEYGRLKPTKRSSAMKSRSWNQRIKEQNKWPTLSSKETVNQQKKQKKKKESRNTKLVYCKSPKRRSLSYRVTPNRSNVNKKI